MLVEVLRVVVIMGIVAVPLSSAFLSMLRTLGHVQTEQVAQSQLMAAAAVVQSGQAGDPCADLGAFQAVLVERVQPGVHVGADCQH